MVPEGYLPCSQEPSTGPYPEPDPSSSYHPILSKFNLNIIPHLRLGLPSGLFPSGFATKIPYAFPFLPYAFCMPCPYNSHSLDHSHYMARYTSYDAPQYTTSSPASYYFILLGSKFLLASLEYKTVQPSISDFSK
jgi:hypothetical protein